MREFAGLGVRRWFAVDARRIVERRLCVAVDRSYTVTEHSSGDYYTRYDDKRVWNLKAGESAPAGGYVTVITNYPRTGLVDLHSIRIGKTVKGVSLGVQGKFDFTLLAPEHQGITKDDVCSSRRSCVRSPCSCGPHH